MTQDLLSPNAVQELCAVASLVLAYFTYLNSLPPR